MVKEAPRFGSRIRALRRREGLSQARMAERLRISPSYLNLIEHNQRPMSALVLLRLAEPDRVVGVVGVFQPEAHSGPGAAEPA